MLMPDLCSLRGAARTVALKWHRARRRASDPAFTMTRIVEGLAQGASVEIDIQPMSDGHFAVLHDPVLDGETTGSGPVARARAADLALLRRRAEDGAILEEPPSTLAALLEAVVAGPAASGVLQINLRCGESALRPGHEIGFARAVAPLAGQALLSGRDPRAVWRLGDGVPGLRLGLDACDGPPLESLRRTRDARAFAEGVAEALPEAAMIHLDHRLILDMDDEDVGLVAALQAGGRQVDARVVGLAGEGGLWEVLRLIALGVDFVTTDDPEGLLAALAGRRPPGTTPAASFRGRPLPIRPAPAARQDVPASGQPAQVPAPRTAA